MLAPLVLTAFLLGASAAPAAAQVEPLPGESWVVPRDGASISASSWPEASPSEMLEFTIYANDYGLVLPLDVEVSTSPALDPDATLADAGRVDSYVATPRATAPEIFSARTSLASEWLSIPGTYYWQAHYADQDGELYGTEVRRLAITARAAPGLPAVATPVPPVVAAPPRIAPAPLPAATVRAIVRRAIVAATQRSPRRLVYRCGASTCRPSWRDNRYAYRGTLQIASGLAGLRASFTGTRTVRRSTRSVHWSVSL